MTHKDPRYKTVHNLIVAGFIQRFAEIFDYIPKSVVALDIGINNNRFSCSLKNVGRLSLNHVFLIASLFDGENRLLLELILLTHEYNLQKEIRLLP